MSIGQILCCIAGALLIGVVGYILFQYFYSIIVNNKMNSKLVGDGNSKAIIQLQDSIPIEDNEDDYSSGYTSD